MQRGPAKPDQLRGHSALTSKHPLPPLILKNFMRTSRSGLGVTEGAWRWTSLRRTAPSAFRRSTQLLCPFRAECDAGTVQLHAIVNKGYFISGPEILAWTGIGSAGVRCSCLAAHATRPLDRAAGPSFTRCRTLRYRNLGPGVRAPQHRGQGFPGLLRPPRARR